MGEEQTKQKHTLRNVFLIVLGIFVVSAAVFGIAFGTLLGNTTKNLVEIVPGPIRDIAEVIAPPTPDPFVKALATDVDYYETGEIHQIPIYEQKKIDKFIFSFLIVVQNGKTDDEDHKSDMFFILSWNPLEQKCTIVAIPRDTLVLVEGYGWKRINAAYSLGGIGLLMNTINESFGLDLQNYVYIGTDELAELVEGLGGIPFRISSEEASYISEQTGTDLKEGVRKLNGKQIIALLLDRSSDNKGAIGRSRTQLRVIQNTYDYMVEEFDSSFVWPFFGLVSKGVRTNFDFEILTSIGYEVVESDELTLKLVVMPYEDSYTEMTFDGAYAILPEFEKNRILLRQELFGIEE